MQIRVTDLRKNNAAVSSVFPAGQIGQQLLMAATLKGGGALGYSNPQFPYKHTKTVKSNLADGY